MYLIEMRPPFYLCCLCSFVSSNAATSSRNLSVRAASEILEMCLCSFLVFMLTLCLHVHNCDRRRSCAAMDSTARSLAPLGCGHKQTASGARFSIFCLSTFRLHCSGTKRSCRCCRVRLCMNAVYLSATVCGNFWSNCSLR